MNWFELKGRIHSAIRVLKGKPVIFNTNIRLGRGGNIQGVGGQSVFIASYNPEEGLTIDGGGRPPVKVVKLKKRLLAKKEEKE